MKDEGGFLLGLGERTVRLEGGQKFINKDGYKRLVNDTKYQNTLKAMMGDCADNNHKIEEVDYSSPSLIAFFKNYNVCKGYRPLIINKENRIKVNIEPIIGLGYVQTNFGLNNDPNVNPLKADFYRDLGSGNFTQSQTFSFGFGTYFVPQFQHRIKFLIDCWFIKNSFKGFAERAYSLNSYKYDLNLNVTSLKLSTGIRLDIAGKSNPVYIKCAAQLEKLTSSSLDIQQTVTDFSGKITTNTFDPKKPLRSSCLAGVIGLGYENKIWKSKSIFLEIRAELSNGYLESESQPQSYLNSIGIYSGVKL